MSKNVKDRATFLIVDSINVHIFRKEASVLAVIDWWCRLLRPPFKLKTDPLSCEYKHVLKIHNKSTR